MEIDANIAALEYESGWEIAHVGLAEEHNGVMFVKDLETGEWHVEENPNIIAGIIDYWAFPKPVLCPDCGETAYVDGGTPDGTGWYICNGCNKSFQVKESE